jgi:flagellar basal body-associated protein FliL
MSLSGCSYKLNYSLNQREITMAKSPSRLRVAVMPLSDNRDNKERSKAAREAVGHPDAGDYTYDDNFAGEVNLEISKMLVKHLEYSGCFQEVALVEEAVLRSGDEQRSQLESEGYDAVLTGSIDNFFGYYDRNSTSDFVFRGLLPAGATIAATLVSIKTETTTFRQPFGGATEFKETSYDPILPSLVLLGTSATGNLIASSSKRDISWQTALTLELTNLRTGEQLWSDRTEVKDQVHASMPSMRNKKRKQEVAVRSLRDAINKTVESLDQSSASLVAAKIEAGSQDLR